MILSLFIIIINKSNIIKIMHRIPNITSFITYSQCDDLVSLNLYIIIKRKSYINKIMHRIPTVTCSFNYLL